ncbi:MAG: tetratricopeptide repeat protein [Thermoguttaceae bacterium]
MRTGFLASALLFSMLTVLSAAAAPPASSSAGLASPAPLVLDDVAEPIKPQRLPTEADRDRVEALTLFATARRHEDREEYAQALRNYQRAMRRDPGSAAAAEAAILTAIRLERYAEAARYAQATAKLHGINADVLGRLVGYLASKGEFDDALKLYEEATSGRRSKADIGIVLQMAVGQLYFMHDKPKPAADCFHEALQSLDHPEASHLDDATKKTLLGEPAQTYQMMGDCFLAADRLPEARICFDRSEKAAPDKAMRQFNLARVALKSDKPADAIEALDAAFAAHLTDHGTAPYETLAEALRKLGKQDELIGRLERLRAASPKELPLGYFLAQQYRTAHQSDKAESLYRELLKVAPTLTGYRELADIHRRANRFDALLDVLGESVEKIGLLDTLDGQLQSLAAEPQIARQIIAAAGARLKASPDKLGYGARVAAALVALEAKQYDRAGEFFETAMATKPKRADEALMVWGVGLLTSDRAAQAAKVFQRAIDDKVLPADNPMFHFYLAGALALDGKTDAALAAARLAAEKRKDVARFAARSAWVLYLGKRYGEAEQEYRKLIERFDADHASPETRDALREARLSLSNLAVMKGDVAQAEEWLEQVLDEFPDDTGAMNDLGYLWADQNKHLGRAERMIRRAVAAEPETAAYRDSLGWLLFRQGKYTQAAVELEKAAAGDKPDGAVLDHLGDTYMKLNQHDKAVAAWRKAAGALRKEKETEKASSIEEKIKGK